MHDTFYRCSPHYPTLSEPDREIKIEVMSFILWFNHHLFLLNKFFSPLKFAWCHPHTTTHTISVAYIFPKIRYFATRNGISNGKLKSSVVYVMKTRNNVGLVISNRQQKHSTKKAITSNCNQKCPPTHIHKANFIYHTHRFSCRRTIPVRFPLF